LRGWTWRTRYSTYLGGIGTGIGEGHEGVECGRGRACLAARIVEKEIDCDAEELAALRAEMDAHSVEDNTLGAMEGTGRRRWSGTSFWSQELEGIGGVMKKKVKKRIKVGATVREWEEERETGVPYLERERRGRDRSWCGWCERVVPGEAER